MKVLYVCRSECSPTAGAIDAGLSEPDCEVTLIPAHAGYADRDRWVTWGDVDHWLSDPSVIEDLVVEDEDASKDAKDALVGSIVDLVSAHARAEGLSPLDDSTTHRWVYQRSAGGGHEAWVEIGTDDQGEPCWYCCEPGQRQRLPDAVPVFEAQRWRMGAMLAEQCRAELAGGRREA